MEERERVERLSQIWINGILDKRYELFIAICLVKNSHEDEAKLRLIIPYESNRETKMYNEGLLTIGENCFFLEQRQ